MATLQVRVAQKDIYLPILRAYALAYASTSSLQLFKIISLFFQRRYTFRATWLRIVKTLRQTASVENFPTCAAILVAASTVTPRLISDVMMQLQRTTDGKRRAASLESNPAVRFVSVLFASMGVFQLLNKSHSKPRPAYPRFRSFTTEPLGLDQTVIAHHGVGESPGLDSPSPVRAPSAEPLAGKTLFMTSFAIIHAAAIVASLGRSAHVASTKLSSSTQKLPSLEPFLNFIAVPSTFAISCAIVMWSWVYFPDRLPESYNSWITTAAEFDHRIIDAMRKARKFKLHYGRPGVPTELPYVARELGLPASYGEPSKVYPIPCEMFHCGLGKTCEIHAVMRFFRGWVFGFKMYLPLMLFMSLRRKRDMQTLQRAFWSASKSATFLGAFVASFCYAVCLARTRIGPLIVGKSIPALESLDRGICVRAGCAASGWSIFFEERSRRKEMALFVAPRALSALLPRNYERKFMWREQLAFAVSTATILTAAKSRPRSVQGLLSRVIGQVYG